MTVKPITREQKEAFYPIVEAAAKRILALCCENTLETTPPSDRDAVKRALDFLSRQFEKAVKPV